KIQEESLDYETKKHDGSYPIVGVNTFRNPGDEARHETPDLARSTEEEKRSQLQRLREFHNFHAQEAPIALAMLKQAAINGDNIFGALMDAVRCCSLGQLTQALFEVGGQYRRGM